MLLLTGKAKTGWHSNSVIRCYRNLLSISFARDICNVWRFDTGVLVIFEYLFGGAMALEFFNRGKLVQYYSLP